MIGNILRRSFWLWWDNLSYSMFTAFVAAINPSFLVFVPTVAFLLTSDVHFLREYWEIWVIIVCTTVGGMWLWPLSVVSHRMHEEMMGGRVVGYFKKLWQWTKELFLPSFAWWLVGTVLGLLFGFLFVFYVHQVVSFSPLWGILFFFSIWFFVLLMMMQMVFVVLLYKSDIKIGEMLLLALYTVIRYAFVYVIIFLISWVIYGVLLVPSATPFLPTPGFTPLLVVIPLVSVYGIGPVIHIWTFRYVFEDVPQEERKRSILEVLLPFAQIWEGIRRLFRGRK